MGVIVTEAMVERARAEDACRVPAVGTRLLDLPASDLEWAETRGILTSADAREVLESEGAEVRGQPTFAGLGYGDDSGDGYGSGYGYGYGYGVTPGGDDE